MSTARMTNVDRILERKPVTNKAGSTVRFFKNTNNTTLILLYFMMHYQLSVSYHSFYHTFYSASHPKPALNLVSKPVDYSAVADVVDSVH